MRDGLEVDSFPVVASESRAYATDWKLASVSSDDVDGWDAFRSAITS